MSPVVISLVNQKGGVSKTTTTANLGAGLARRGYRVLVVDLDSQTNLTQSLIGDLEEGSRCVATCMLEETGLNEIIQPTKTEGLHIAPAGEDMTGMDLNLNQVISREQVLSRCLAKTNLEPYSVVLIDTAPYISLLSVNALVASTHYLVPTIAEYLPLKGIERLSQNVEKVRGILNHGLTRIGVVITQYDTRKGITAQVEETMQEILGDELLKTRIRVNTKFSSSPIDQQTIYQYEDSPQGRGTEDYDALTSEVLARLGMSEPTQRRAANG
jgi:chromosome partitioning protein